MNCFAGAGAGVGVGVVGGVGGGGFGDGVELGPGEATGGALNVCGADGATARLSTVPQPVMSSGTIKAAAKRSDADMKGPSIDQVNNKIRCATRVPCCREFISCKENAASRRTPLRLEGGW